MRHGHAERPRYMEENMPHGRERLRLEKFTEQANMPYTYPEGISACPVF